ncbi:TPA: flagellar biosynthesis protein FlgL [Yersinia enterocolitica]|uniref:flagellin N-terminal helical domain-containing protein n=3 Tax=Yersinia enterocolitica TaxID=630 RepID=UPI000327E351|nr:flagellar biosynthesis protein FlgL [Yersinia enterocolitica]CCV60267.1 putative flagellar hook-associated protein [Yersinia enterocolitica (type O:2) str. YE3094/96]CFV29331.1 flagellar hook-associated protein FlgL [Yersinia enterocolitica]CNE98906.1 flagellar hook-associated protein FlgL [Yersinia enterocolitica]HDL6967157.1 flagellar biosynthesis protein FlgL [Yersinia enterocolitica]HDL6971613.1 flagellar biosynthesis protein FlgL [Yersinia enterocolitica]
MRVTNTSMSRIMMDSMANRTVEYAKLNEQLTSGKRVNKISDDPVASMQLVQLENSKSDVNQYKTNVVRLSGNYSVQEASLKSLEGQLLVVRDKLLAAKNGNHSATESATFGREINLLLDGMMSDLNTKNSEGNYLFAGTKTNIEPVEYNKTTQTYTFKGNNERRDAVVGNGITLQENTDLSSSLSVSGNNLEILTNLKKLANKMIDSSIKPAAYNQEISDNLAAIEIGAKKIGGMLTDLGAKQNRLEHLSNLHDDVEIVNANLEKDLAGIDILQVNSAMQSNFLSTKIAHSMQAKISQLSLFNYI